MLKQMSRTLKISDNTSNKIRLHLSYLRGVFVQSQTEMSSILMPDATNSSATILAFSAAFFSAAVKARWRLGAGGPIIDSID